MHEFYCWFVEDGGDDGVSFFVEACFCRGHALCVEGVHRDGHFRYGTSSGDGIAQYLDVDFFFNVGEQVDYYSPVIIVISASHA